MAIDRGRLDIYFETRRYILRSLTLADATGRWAGWLNDPIAARMLNARPRAFTLDELRDYIAGFDQTTRLLLGIFDRASGLHIGIMVADIVDQGRRIAPSVLIGEAPYRRVGVMTELGDAVHDYFFETLAFEAAVAHVLARNEAVIALLEMRGWKRVGRLPGARVSVSTGEPLDLLVYEMTREFWRDKARRSPETR
jgi:RimJ/RimL family protein N-acetyltransferase